MASPIIPYLCGGTFFTQIVRAKKKFISPSGYLKEQKEKFSEKSLFRELINIFQLKDLELSDSTYKTNASNFKSCKKPLDNIIGFNNLTACQNFDTDIHKNNSIALKMTTNFVTTFIREDNYENLAKCLLGLIAEDTSIDNNTEFYIYPNNIKKEQLIKCKQINLPALILGIWRFIAISRPKSNQKGADTYKIWYPAQKRYCKRINYTGTVGTNINHIKITCNNLATNNLNLENTDSDSFSSTSASPSLPKLSKRDFELLTKFTKDFKNILHTCSQSDFIVFPMPFELPPTTDDLISKWDNPIMGFKNPNLENLREDIIYELNEYILFFSIHMDYNIGSNSYTYNKQSDPNLEGNKKLVYEKRKKIYELYKNLCEFIKNYDIITYY